MRRFRRADLALLLVACLTVGAACTDDRETQRKRGTTPPPAAIRLVDAGTDNYKASFNADPEVPERRTWLTIEAVEVDGVRWKPTASEFGPKGEARFADDVNLTARSASRRATLRVVSGPAQLLRFRLGPQAGRWGPLLEITSAEDLGARPVEVEMSVAGEGGKPRRLRLTYRRDPSLARAPTDSLEHNGPGGRWVVAGLATRTNVELGWE